MTQVKALNHANRDPEPGGNQGSSEVGPLHGHDNGHDNGHDHDDDGGGDLNALLPVPLGVHPHVHDEESLRRILHRLARIEGHVRGIKTMVQESRPCPDVLVQIAAVRAALNRVSRMILDEHLTQCLVRAAEQGNMEAEIQELRQALDRFLP